MSCRSRSKSGGRFFFKVSQTISLSTAKYSWTAILRISRISRQGKSGCIAMKFSGRCEAASPIDDEVPDHRVDGFAIGNELLETHSGGVFRNGFDRLGNIGNALFPSSKRHESPLSRYPLSSPYGVHSGWRDPRCTPAVD